MKYMYNSLSHKKNSICFCISGFKSTLQINLLIKQTDHISCPFIKGYLQCKYFPLKSKDNKYNKTFIFFDRHTCS